MTPERKAELREFARGYPSPVLAEVLDALDDRDRHVDKLQAGIIETRGNFDGAQARIAELESLLTGRIAGHEHVFNVVARHVSSELATYQIHDEGDLLQDAETLGPGSRGALFGRIAEAAADEIVHADVAKLEADLAEAHGRIDALNAKVEGYRIEIASLQHQHRADAARIAGLEAEANRRLVERDARVDEVAAEAQAERVKRELIEAAAREVLDLRDRHGVIAFTGMLEDAYHAFAWLRDELRGGQ